MIGIVAGLLAGGGIVVGSAIGGRVIYKRSTKSNAGMSIHAYIHTYVRAYVRKIPLNRTVSRKLKYLNSFLTAYYETIGYFVCS